MFASRVNVEGISFAGEIWELPLSFAFYLHDKVLFVHGKKFRLLNLILVFLCHSDPSPLRFIIIRCWSFFFLFSFIEDKSWKPSWLFKRKPASDLPPTSRPHPRFSYTTLVSLTLIEFSSWKSVWTSYNWILRHLGSLCPPVINSLDLAVI
jgi:hypothetical protein